MMKKLLFLWFLLSVVFFGAKAQNVDAVGTKVDFHVVPDDYSAGKLIATKYFLDYDRQAVTILDSVFTFDAQTDTTIVIEAVAKPGCKFVKWSDGDTLSYKYFDTYTLRNISRVDLVAYFEKAGQVDFHVVSNDYSAGNLIATKYFLDYDKQAVTILDSVFTFDAQTDTTIVIEAVAKPGCKFVKWSDGEKNAKRYFDTYTLRNTSNVDLVAYFEKAGQVDFHVVSNDYSAGNLIATKYFLDYDKQAVTILDSVFTFDAQTDTTIVIEAVAKPGYKFAKWSDGEKNAKRYFDTYTLRNVSSVDLVAYFEKAGQVDFHVVSNDYSAGNLIATKYFLDYDRQAVTILDSVFTFDAQTDTTIVIEAVAKPGYKFAKWSDGEKNAKRYFDTYTLRNVSSVDLVAYFEKVSVGNIVEFYVRPYDYNGGYIEITKTLKESGKHETFIDSVFTFDMDRDSFVVLQAFANPGYKFIRWIDGDTSMFKVFDRYSYDPGTEVVMDAYFELDMDNSFAYFNIRPQSENYGSVKIVRTSRYNLPSEVMYGPGVAFSLPMDSALYVSAIANPGYKFSRWSDGDTLSTKSYYYNELKPGQEVSLVAYFVEDESQIENNIVEIHVQPLDYSAGYISSVILTYDGKINDLGHDSVFSFNFSTDSSVIISAVPNDGYKFARWSDGSTMSERYFDAGSLENKDFVLLIAYFERLSDTVSVNAIASNDSLGYVVGGGLYMRNDTACLKAVAVGSSVFYKWSDGLTSETRTIYCQEDVDLVAIFKKIEGWSDNMVDEPLVADTTSETKKVSLTIDLEALGLSTEQLKHVTVQASIEININSDAEARVECYADAECTQLLGVIDLKANLNDLFNGARLYSNANRLFKPAATEKYSEVSSIPEGTKYLKVVVEDDEAASIEDLQTQFANVELQVARKSFNINLESDNEDCEVLGAGEYFGGDEVEIEAVEKAGYEFLRWSDGVTDRVRKIVASDDILLTAIFAPELVGVSEADAQAIDVVVNVYDVNGVVVRTGVKRSVALDGLNHGFYIVGGEKIRIVR